MQGFLPWKKILIFGVELFFGINVLLLDAFVFLQTHNQISSIATTFQRPIPTPIQPCPIDCVKLIEQATASAIQQMQATQVPTTIQTTTQVTSGVKEYFVPLGSGQTNATTMTDVAGVQSYLNSSAYPNIKSVNFEVAVQIPNGNQTANIQLFDVTDGYVIWNSQMSFSGGGAQYLVSNPIQLPPGNKLYQVQMSTQLGSLTLLNSSRIHITLN